MKRTVRKWMAGVMTLALILGLGVKAPDSLAAPKLAKTSITMDKRSVTTVKVKGIKADKADMHIVSFHAPLFHLFHDDL